MDHNRPWSNTIYHLQGTVLQEPQESTRVLGHTMVWPRFEVVLVDGPPNIITLKT